MNNQLSPKHIVIWISILSVFCFSGLVLAQESKTAPSSEGISDAKQEQARKYREIGVEYQKIGNLSEALSFYQKAIAIYPNFAMAYNDIGVIYEALGSLEQAEENYLKSTKIDPVYSSAYTNLALFYESQRDLEKAAFYWGKRAAVGDPDDPWTRKAAIRLRDIRMSLSGQPFADERESDILGLMTDITEDKAEFNKDDRAMAQMYFNKAKLSFNRQDLATAIKEALDAQYLDQDNPEIEEFIEKVERRALTR